MISRRALFGAVGVLAILAGATAFLYQREIQRVRFAMSMFSGREMVEAFRTMHDVFPGKWIRSTAAPSPLVAGPALQLPQTFEYGGDSKDVATFLRTTDTTGLLVLHHGAVVFEDYYRGNNSDSRHISWSVGKSYVSALVGIATEEGRISGVEAAITDYVPELVGSAYDQVPIKDVLQMSSGARWNEDYSDRNSDINRFGLFLATGGALNEFTATLTREFQPGTFNRYNSADTQALGMLLRNATGVALSDYLDEKIWQPIGCEADAYWLTDDSGMELAFGGLNITVRDYARFGQLFLQNGEWDGVQVVPAQWVQDSVTPDAPHLQPGDNPASDFGLGYGYQWWLMDGVEGEYSAIGIYNQFIYVHPTKSLVIVKTSANSEYGLTDDETSYREMETIAFFRQIARQLPQ